jgi:thioredoxin reductase (NADPH)
MITGEVVGLKGAEHLEAVVEAHNAPSKPIILFRFWSYAKLGPIGDWGLEIEKNCIKVNNIDYQTNIPNFAIGDEIRIQETKIDSFRIPTLMCQAAYQIINPGKRYVLKIHYRFWCRWF